MEIRTVHGRQVAIWQHPGDGIRDASVSVRQLPRQETQAWARSLQKANR